MLTAKSGFKEFQTISTKEFSFLRDEAENISLKVLEELFSLQLIKRIESPSGSMWLNNFDALEL
jgi:hypothetical protein